MIFAAGAGIQLDTHTDNTPKALIPVAGKPMLEHLIIKLKRAGFNQIVINVHHLADQIIDFLNKNNNFGIEICISDEKDYLLDTGGAIKKAQAFLAGDEPFLVHNVDILSNVDLGKLYETHVQSDSLATLLVGKREASRYLLFNNENKLCGWRNKETGEIKSHFPDFIPEIHTDHAFGGIHVLSPEIFDWMDEWTGKFSIINFYLSIATKAMIKAYPLEDLRLLDIDKPNALEIAEDYL